MTKTAPDWASGEEKNRSSLAGRSFRLTFPAGRETWRGVPQASPDRGGQDITRCHLRNVKRNERLLEQLSVTLLAIVRSS